jgi:hypothetical protein
MLMAFQSQRQCGLLPRQKDFRQAGVDQVATVIHLWRARFGQSPLNCSRYFTCGHPHVSRLA